MLDEHAQPGSVLITRQIAIVIMVALESVSHAHIPSNCGLILPGEFDATETALVRELYRLFPEIVAEYDWLPAVESVMSEEP